MKLIQKKFPHAHLTVVEHDSKMVELAQENLDKKYKNKLEIILADAEEAVAQFTQKCDLVLIDLFNGKDPSPLIASLTFQNNIKNILSESGFILVNVYNQKYFLKEFKKEFSLWHVVHFRRSYVGVFRNFGQGLIGEKIPADLFIPLTDEHYIATDSVRFNVTPLNIEGAAGTLWTAGPLRICQFYGDIEPNVKKIDAHFIMWQPFTILRPTGGWKRAPLIMNFGKTGYVKLESEYWKSWTTNMQTNRKKFLSQNEYVVNEMSHDEYRLAFLGSKTSKKLGPRPMLRLAKKIEKYKNSVSMYSVGFMDCETFVPVAGLATLDFPEKKYSLHLNSFLTDQAPLFAGTALIDNWFITSFKKDFLYLDFGQFYSKGYPKSWLGFSRFKSSFGTHFISYPEIFIKTKFRKAK